MSQDKTISISYKLEGDNGGFKKLAVDAESFRKVIALTVQEADKFKKAINFAAIATGFDSISKTLGDFNSAGAGNLSKR